MDQIPLQRYTLGKVEFLRLLGIPEDGSISLIHYDRFSEQVEVEVVPVK